MVNNDFRAELPHSIQLEERHRLAVTGVSEVLSFDENEVIMDTSLGLLTVEGEGLHVEKLSLDMGERASYCRTRTPARAPNFHQTGFYRTRSHRHATILQCQYVILDQWITDSALRLSDNEAQ